LSALSNAAAAETAVLERSTSGAGDQVCAPGRIDASCILVYGLIPDANQGAIVHAPLPQTPQPTGRPSGAASAYGRRIG
jgi:hypothetical protein